MILVTGAAGYIGSHTCLELLNAGYQVLALDNLSNSNPESLTRVREIAQKDLEFHQVDILDREGLKIIFDSCPIDAVIHFAGLKSVSESVADPLRYYHNNVTGSITLFDVMAEYNVKSLVFSSSATVYGSPTESPVKEDFPLSPVNPYGHTKMIIEGILRNLHQSDDAWRAVVLRYFNPAGAHSSGRIGEDPRGIPSNLFPCMAQAALGRRPELLVYGNDYPTPDGTGVRDYIHIVDLAVSHVQSLRKLPARPGVSVYNLGTGRGYSVLEIISEFESACGKKIPYRITGRRAGDIAVCYTDPSKAQTELGWSAVRSLQEMCLDTWRWQSGNPDGYN